MKLAQTDEPFDTLLVEVLVPRRQEASAIGRSYFDRLEGRSRQHLEIADVTAMLRSKSDAELQFHLDHDRWPDEQEMLLLDTTHHGTE